MPLVHRNTTNPVNSRMCPHAHETTSCGMQSVCWATAALLLHPVVSWLRDAAEVKPDWRKQMSDTCHHTRSYLHVMLRWGSREPTFHHWGLPEPFLSLCWSQLVGIVVGEFSVGETCRVWSKDGVEKSVRAATWQQLDQTQSLSWLLAPSWWSDRITAVKGMNGFAFRSFLLEQTSFCLQVSWPNWVYCSQKIIEVSSDYDGVLSLPS